MHIAELRSRDETRYNEVARRYGSIFATEKWTGLFGDKVRRYGIYNRNGELIGGFTTYREKKLWASVFRDPPFTPAVIPFLKVEATNPVAVMDTWKKVLQLMAEFIDNLPYAVVSFSLGGHVVDMQPFIWRRFRVMPAYTYILDLSESLDGIWSGMSSERRKNITKAAKDGLTVKRTLDMNVVRGLVMKTFSRQGTIIDEACLGGILYDYAAEDNSAAFVSVDRDDRPIACSFCLFDRNKAYYLLGGYDDENRHHGAGALSMWESIKYAKNAGLEYFDFEGSMIPRVEVYFRGFGGRLTPYYRIHKARLPYEIGLRFMKRGLYR